jgi:rubrerythrin
MNVFECAIKMEQEARMFYDKPERVVEYDGIP